jgi:predicted P-loop ATPase
MDDSLSSLHADQEQEFASRAYVLLARMQVLQATPRNHVREINLKVPVIADAMGRFRTGATALRPMIESRRGRSDIEQASVLIPAFEAIVSALEFAIDESNDLCDGYLAEQRVADVKRRLVELAASPGLPALIAVRPPALPAVVPDWENQLIVSGEGDTPKALLANATLVLRNHLDIRGTFGFDTFGQRVVFLKPPPWDQHADVYGATELEISDVDVYRATEWMQRVGEIHVKDTIVGQAIDTVAREFSFHPLRDYLNCLIWDQIPRLDTWIIVHAGAADTPINRAMSGKFLISAVARAMQQGCKVDTVPILEGPQGKKKSSALRILAGPYFTDHLPDLTNKDAMIQLQGKWIVEIAELAAMEKAAPTRIKSFITSQVDRFRPPHGRRAQDFPRQSVFVGTVNPEGGYLRDPTGARRFWPIECRQPFDLVALEKERDQLWAEAVARYKAGEHWWLDDTMEADAAEVQADRRQTDVRDELIGNYIAGRPYVAIGEILKEVLHLRDESDWEQKYQNLVAHALIARGWKRGKQKSSIDPKRPWVYFAPDSVPVDGVDGNTGTQTGTDEIPF